MVICIYGASSDQIDPAYLRAGEELGLAMARRGHSWSLAAAATA